MAEVFDESTRLDLARGAYGGFWRFRDKGAFTTRRAAAVTLAVRRCRGTCPRINVFPRGV